MDGVHHELQHGVNEAAGLFRVKVVDEGGGASHVGKESGDGFALTLGRTSCLQGGLLGEDTLGKMLGGVARRGLRARG